jgi:hypothetical protein
LSSQATGHETAYFGKTADKTIAIETISLCNDSLNVLSAITELQIPVKVCQRTGRTTKRAQALAVHHFGESIRKISETMSKRTSGWTMLRLTGPSTTIGTRHKSTKCSKMGRFSVFTSQQTDGQRRSFCCLLFTCANRSNATCVRHYCTMFNSLRACVYAHNIHVLNLSHNDLQQRK